MGSLDRFPGAPAGSWVSDEGWLICGGKAWTVAEWRAFLAPRPRPRRRHDIHELITDHQYELIQSYAELGLHRLVAERYGLSIQSVRNQLSTAYHRLGVSNGMQAVNRLRQEEAA